MFRTIGPVLLLLLGACTDPDGDGATNREERELGLDPQDPDTDNDGLLDGEELVIGSDPFDPDSDRDFLLDGEEVYVAGTHPMEADTDGDSYLDGNEWLEGTDPLNAANRIYQGKWPYHRDKDSIGKKAFAGGYVEEGERIGQWVTRDQNWDRVNLYDFAWETKGEAKYIVLQSDAYW